MAKTWHIWGGLEDGGDSEYVKEFETEVARMFGIPKVELFETFEKGFNSDKLYAKFRDDKGGEYVFDHNAQQVQRKSDGKVIKMV